MDKTEIEKLHADLLNAWNKQDAAKMASLFTDNGISIGIDGSEYNGRNEIENERRKIYKDHQTAEYIWKVKGIHFLHEEVATLRAIVGMISHRQKDINPAANAIQTIIAIKQESGWKIELFQNTPAQFHGRPEAVAEMTKELSLLK